jgi:hypothetical protein
MPDTKITALTAITTVDPAADVLPIVDISDTSMAASGTTKKVTSNQILGAGGTATLASATITGDLTVDTSTLKVDSANNRVGINTATPTAGNVLDIVSATSNNFIRFTDSVNATGYLGIASTGSAYLHGNNNKVSLSCSTSNTTPTEQFRITNPGVFEFLDGAGGTRMTLNSTGLGVGVVPSAGKGALQLSSGINFPATQVASSDANTLDDYEEGTWVGTLKGATTDPTIAVTATGRYTKVGRLVSVQISFSNVNTTGASGDAYIIGLPFANSSITVHGSAASYLALTFSGYLGSEADPGGTNISLFDIRSGNVWASAQHSAGTSRYINAELTYTVA